MTPLTATPSPLDTVTAAASGSPVTADAVAWHVEYLSHPASSSNMMLRERTVDDTCQRRTDALQHARHPPDEYNLKSRHARSELLHRDQLRGWQDSGDADSCFKLVQLFGKA